MDPDAPQPSVPVIPTEAPDEDASVAAPPTEPVEPPGIDPLPEPDEADPAAPAASLPLPQPTAPQVPSQTLSPAPPITDATSAAAPPFDPHSADEIHFLKTVLGPKSAASLHARTNSRLERIMEFAQKKGTVDRNDVRLLLRVSATTASSYLTTLYNSGRLTRHHTQHDTVYRVVG